MTLKNKTLNVSFPSLNDKIARFNAGKVLGKVKVTTFHI